MRYSYHDLYDLQFETFVVSLCHELLGAGVQGFAPGPDGGRDARFCGTAQRFPSTTSPWDGTFIIQSKHTSSPVAKFSDGDFSGPGKSSVISKEIPRIRKLAKTERVDRYLVFSNRRLGAEANTAILARLTKETEIQHCHLIGLEAIDQYVKNFGGIAADIEDFATECPLRASPDELAEVITVLARHLQSLMQPASFQPTQIQRVRFQDKNVANGLSKEYAHLITRTFLKDFGLVKEFLEDPVNLSKVRNYEDAAAEFQSKLIVYRSEFSTFDRLLDYLVDKLLERDGDLRANKRLTRTLLYYMYWNCDIGQEQEQDEPEADADA